MRPILPRLLSKKCAVKSPGLQRVQLPPGNWFAPLGSNRGGDSTRYTYNVDASVCQESSKSFPAGLLPLKTCRLVFTGYLAATLQVELSKQLVQG
jgi:hypothetical protein